MTTISSINTNRKIAPKLFLLYVSFASMIMFFSAFCSALIVRKGDYRQSWADIILPDAFLISTLIIIISSVTIQLAYNHILKSKNVFMRWGFVTWVLSVLFIFLQYKGWMELQSKEIFLKGNPSGSYIYVVSFFHGLHYIGGILFLSSMLYKARKSSMDDARKMNWNILIQYWHFIGLIWVMLFLFFKFIIYK